MMKSLHIRQVGLVVILGATLILTTGIATAQSRLGGGSSLSDWLGRKSPSSLGLIDPSRLSINHNLSFGFASGGGSSLAQSFYSSQFAYELSNPVTLTFLLGASNTRVLGDERFAGSQSSILGGFAMDYHPTRDFHLRIEYLNAPLNYSIGDRYQRGFWAMPGNR